MTAERADRGRRRRGARPTHRRCAAIGAVVAALVLVSALVPAAAATPGQLDPTFGGDGVVSLILPVGDGSGRQLVLVDTRGRTLHVTGGYTGGAGPGDLPGPTVIRLLGNGAQDPAFGGTGEVITPAPPVTTDGPVDAVVGPDDAVTVLSAGAAVAVLTRVRADGVPDPAFGSGGSVVLPVALTPAALALRPDGTLVLVGTMAVGGTNRATAVRVLPSGALDPTFGDAGVSVAPDDGTWLELSDVAAAGAGEVVATGRGAAGFVTGPIAADGTFGAPLPGSAAVRSALASTRGARLAIGGDGSITVAAEVLVTRVDLFTYQVEESRLVRFRPDGTRDPSFAAFCCGFRVTGLALERGGGVVVSGQGLSYLIMGIGTLPLAERDRVGPHGAIDPAFQGNGFAGGAWSASLDDVVLTPAAAILYSGWGNGGMGYETYVARLAGVDTPVVVPVTGVTAGLAGTTATLTWDDPPTVGPAVTGYVVEDSAGHRLTVDGSARSAVVPGLPAGTTVTFTVRALTVHGLGPASTAQVTTAAPSTTTSTTTSSTTSSTTTTSVAGAASSTTTAPAPTSAPGSAGTATPAAARAVTATPALAG